MTAFFGKFTLSAMRPSGNKYEIYAYITFMFNNRLELNTKFAALLLQTMAEKQFITDELVVPYCSKVIHKKHLDQPH